ncbi:MAG TPA: PD-(D/E)XK nuclease family protein [Egibacteraceae bacterium]|nr:PD-(D/E)XK nuclease family protein [Egibacteraceae bacterium]
MGPLDRLSPSKINSFRDCPQHFAFRYIDGLDEPEDPVMLRGTLVHEVCERLFDLPPASRTRVTAVALLHRLFERMVDRDPPLRALFDSAEAVWSWLRSAERLLDTWFRLETPAEIDVAGCELFVETVRDDTVLAGIVDRLDRLPDGTYAITDYKTGPAPGPGWELRGFFQLRFYATVLADQHGLRVSRLRLVHLGDGGEVLELALSAQSVAGVDGQIRGLSAAMRRAVDQGCWVANVGRRCQWCAFRDRCPAAS